MWFFAAKWYDFSEDTWIYRKGLIDASNAKQYLVSFYWSLQTVLTVGYGDFPAVTSFEKLICIFWEMTGVGFYSYMIGNIT